MSLRRRSVKLTYEEYELLPFEPGWVCEYHNGRAHFMPRYHPVVTTLQITPRQAEAACPLRPARPDDAAALLEAYVAAFGVSIEYCEDTPEQLASAARRALAQHFSGERGNPLAASRVAVDPQAPEKLLGAALLTSGKDSARLDLLFVHPRWQGRGLASALVAEAVNQLYRFGERKLMSRYHIGNEASRAWHQRFGFREEPDLRRAQLYLQAAQHELWRRERLGLLNTVARQLLTAEAAQWEAEVERLSVIQAEQGYEAVSAIYRW
jgi:RimJ/RimL family protein N-acetyltransferase